MQAPQIAADTYIEVGFGAGSVASGKSAEMQFRFAKDDWSNYNQSDDFSFNSIAQTYVDSNKIAVYLDGTLIGGSEL